MERVWREGEEMDGVKERVGREGEWEDVEAGRGEGIGGVRQEGEGRDDRIPQISQRGYANDVWSCWSGRNSMGSLFCETRNSSEHMPPVGGVAQW